MGKTKSIFGIAAVLFLAGCGGKHASFAVPTLPSTFGKSLYADADYKADLARYSKFTDPGGTPDVDQAKIARNSIAYGLMSNVDEMFGRYTAGLFTGKGAAAVLGDSAQLGLTAAATIGHASAIKTLLSTLATAFTGVNLSYDKNFFAQQTFQAVAIAMQVRRDKARHAIVTALQEDVGAYPLTAVKRDIVSYFYAGTLPGGLQEIQAEAGAAAASAAATQPKAALH